MAARSNHKMRVGFRAPAPSVIEEARIGVIEASRSRLTATAAPRRALPQRAVQRGSCHHVAGNIPRGESVGEHVAAAVSGHGGPVQIEATSALTKSAPPTSRPLAESRRQRPPISGCSDPMQKFEDAPYRPELLALLFFGLSITTPDKWERPAIQLAWV
jgi:hypothetical protein